jgi:predicted amidophosphoribosyltransferase
MNMDFQHQQMTTTSLLDPPTARSAGWVDDTPEIRSVLFGSCYAYSPHGNGTACDHARRLCARLKSSDPTWLPKFAACVFAQAIGRGLLADLFGSDVLLVPVPGSSPGLEDTWPAERLATCLKRMGLAGAISPLLRRTVPVRKSATALAGERPTVSEHYSSFTVVPASDTPCRILLVDDVMTKGRTIFAAALRLHKAFPSADIRAFALIRTLRFESELGDPIDPCQGEVRWTGFDTRRRP